MIQRQINYSAVWLILLTAVFTPVKTAICASSTAPLPFSLAPRGQFGGIIAGEFDRRTISDDLIYVRRLLFRMGLTPSSAFSFWAEGGLASLQLFIADRQPQGAPGPAFGGGWNWNLNRFAWRSWTPFLAGRASWFQSKLSDDVRLGGVVQSRRSRFEWNEAGMMAGASQPMAKSLWSAGFVVRYLSQEEQRSMRTGSNVRKSSSTYTSGLRPGFALGWRRDFKPRLVAMSLIEVYPEGGRILVGIGQWGSP